MVEPATMAAIIGGVVEVGKFIYTSINSSSESKKLIEAVESGIAKLEDAIEDATEKITDAVRKEIVKQNLHNALGLAYTARESVDLWVTYPREQRIGEAADQYWEAEGKSQEAISLLRTDPEGKYLNFNEISLSQLGLVAFAVSIRLHLLVCGSQVFESQKVALMSELNKYSNFTDSALNYLSPIIDDQISNSMPDIVNRYRIDPETRRREDYWVFKGHVYDSYNEAVDARRLALNQTLKLNGAKLLMPILQEWRGVPIPP